MGVTCCRGIGLHLGSEGGWLELVAGVVETASHDELAFQRRAHHITPWSRHAGYRSPGFGVRIKLCC